MDFRQQLRAGPRPTSPRQPSPRPSPTPHQPLRRQRPTRQQRRRSLGLPHPGHQGLGQREQHPKCRQLHPAPHRRRKRLHRTCTITNQTGAAAAALAWRQAAFCRDGHWGHPNGCAVVRPQLGRFLQVDPVKAVRAIPTTMYVRARSTALTSTGRARATASALGSLRDGASCGVKALGRRVLASDSVSTPRIRDALTLGVGAYLPGELLVRGPTPEFAPQTSRASRLSPTSPSRRCPPSSS